MASLRRGKEEKDLKAGILPSENSAKEGSVETLWRRESPLDLSDGHLVLGGGGQEGEAAWHGAEDVRGQGGHHHVLLQVLKVRRGRGDVEGVLRVDGGSGVDQVPSHQLVGGEGGRPLGVGGGQQGEVGGGGQGGGDRGKLPQGGGRGEVGRLTLGDTSLAIRSACCRTILRKDGYTRILIAQCS